MRSGGIIVRDRLLQQHLKGAGLDAVRSRPAAVPRVRRRPVVLRDPDVDQQLRHAEARSKTRSTRACRSTGRTWPRSGRPIQAQLDILRSSLETIGDPARPGAPPAVHQAGQVPRLRPAARASCDSAGYSVGCSRTRSSTRSSARCWPPCSRSRRSSRPDQDLGSCPESSRRRSRVAISRSASSSLPWLRSLPGSRSCGTAVLTFRKIVRPAFRAVRDAARTCGTGSRATGCSSPRSCWPRSRR